MKQKDELKDNTINRRLSTIIRVLNVAHEKWDGWLPQPTAYKIEKFDESEYERHYYLTSQEVTDFIGAISDKEAKPLFLLVTCTGM